MKSTTLLFAVFGFVALLSGGSGAKNGCFKRMKSLTGWFASPNYPLRYRPNQYCEYIIRPGQDYVVEITFTRFKLEPRYGGNKTDYIQIRDGGKTNRQQDLIYDGAQRSGFTFMSLTSRIHVEFHSDAQFEYHGFYATYRAIKRECNALELDHGNANCDLTAEGYSSSCTVSCDETFKLEGNSKIFCQGTEYNAMPKCVRDSGVKCNMDEVNHVTVNCEKDDETGVESDCTYECPREYLPPDDNKLFCVEDIWDHIPECKPRPTVDCNLTEVEDYSPDCQRDPVTNVLTTCSFDCSKNGNPNYIPVNFLACNNGIWSKVVCIPDPDIMDKCLNESLPKSKENADDDNDDPDPSEDPPCLSSECSPSESSAPSPLQPSGDSFQSSPPPYVCPFDEQEQEEYIKVFFDDMRELKELPGQAKGRGTKAFACYPKFCWVHAHTRIPVVNCRNHALKFQKKYGINNQKRQRREDICFKCRANDCSKSVVFF